jgi:Tfp pilus assembly protein PilF
MAAVLWMAVHRVSRGQFMTKRKRWIWITIVLLLLGLGSYTYYHFRYLPMKVSDELYQGMQYYFTRDYPSAERLLRKVIKSDANKLASITACTKLAEIYISEKKYDESIELLQKAISLSPSDKGKTPHHFLGVAYYYKGSYADAEKELRTSLSIDPKSVDNHYYLGMINLKEGNRSLALKEFNAEITNGRHAEAEQMINKLKNEN